MYVKKPKKQCPHNEGVECDEDDVCECCGWNPAGRTKRRETKIKRAEIKDGRKIASNNKSGHTGVCWNGRREKWTAEIRRGRKRTYLGSFENLEDAIKARKEAEERMLPENN
jgi:hypothetical protein